MRMALTDEFTPSDAGTVFRGEGSAPATEVGAKRSETSVPGKNPTIQSRVAIVVARRPLKICEIHGLVRRACFARSDWVLPWSASSRSTFVLSRWAAESTPGRLP